MDELKPFTTDECSGLFMSVVHWWWRVTGRAELSAKVKALCVEHDKAYHPGGTALDRFKADVVLALGVAELGQVFLARCMMFGLGFGGHWILPFPWRWGYGGNFPTRYQRKT